MATWAGDSSISGISGSGLIMTAAAAAGGTAIAPGVITGLNKGVMVLAVYSDFVTDLFFLGS